LKVCEIVRAGKQGATSVLGSVSRFQMLPLRRLLPLTLLACLLVAVPAHAKSTQEVTFEAPRDLLDPAHRDAAFAELDTLGVKALRVVL
jgi:hypothetical protein